MSDNKSILNWSQTFKMSSRAPAIDDRIFSTYAEMITYCQSADATAVDGLTLSVSGGTTDEIGSYYVVSGAGTENVLVTKNVTELNFEADDTLNTAITVSKQVGYLNVGKNFPKGTMLETIMHEMLEKELTPSVNTNTLSLTITPSNTTRIYEIGDVLTCQSVTFNAIRQMKANDYNGNVTPQVVDADAVDLYVKGISGTTELSSKTEQANIVSLVVSNPFGESGTQFTVAHPSINLSGAASGATNTKTCKTSNGNSQVVNFSAVTASANYTYNSYYCAYSYFYTGATITSFPPLNTNGVTKFYLTGNTQTLVTESDKRRVAIYFPNSYRVSSWKNEFGSDVVDAYDDNSQSFAHTIKQYTNNSITTDYMLITDNQEELGGATFKNIIITKK